MNTICTRCGSPDVSCEAMINPNTNELRNYTDEAFLYGWCETCGFGSILTDTDEVKSEIENISGNLWNCMLKNRIMLSATLYGKTAIRLKR